MFNMNLHFSPSTSEFFHLFTEVDGMMRSYTYITVLKTCYIALKCNKVIVYITVLKNTAKVKRFGLQILK